MKDESLFLSMPKQVVVYPCSYHAMFNSSQIETRTLRRHHQTQLQIERANRQLASRTNWHKLSSNPHLDLSNSIWQLALLALTQAIVLQNIVYSNYSVLFVFTTAQRRHHYWFCTNENAQWEMQFYYPEQFGSEIILVDSITDIPESKTIMISTLLECKEMPCSCDNEYYLVVVINII